MQLNRTALDEVRDETSARFLSLANEQWVTFEQMMAHLRACHECQAEDVISETAVTMRGLLGNPPGIDTRSKSNWHPDMEDVEEEDA